MSFLTKIKKAKLKLSFTGSETKDIHLLLRNRNTANAYELYTGQYINRSWKSITLRNMSTENKFVYCIESDGYWNNDSDLITMTLSGGDGMTTVKATDIGVQENILQLSRFRIISEGTMVVEVSLYA